MARIEIKGLAIGVVQNTRGDVIAGTTFTCSGTVYAAATGGTTLTGSQLKTNIDGEMPGWLEPGVYTISVPITSKTTTFEVGGGAQVSYFGAEVGIDIDGDPFYDVDNVGPGVLTIDDDGDPIITDGVIPSVKLATKASVDSLQSAQAAIEADGGPVKLAGESNVLTGRYIPGGSLSLIRAQITIAPSATTSPDGDAQIALIPNDDISFAQDRTAMIQFYPEREYVSDASIKAHRHRHSTTTTGSVTFPQGTINVVAASGSYGDFGGFPSSGTAYIVAAGSGAAPTPFTYTGKTSNSLTGCSGGSGTFATGSVVVSSAVADRHIQIHTKNAAGNNLTSRFEIGYLSDDPYVLITSAHLEFDDNAYMAARTAGVSIESRADMRISKANAALAFKQPGDGLTIYTGRLTTDGIYAIRPAGGADAIGGLSVEKADGTAVFQVEAQTGILSLPKAAAHVATASAGGGQAVPATVAGYFYIRDSGGVLRKSAYFA